MGEAIGFKSNIGNSINYYLYLLGLDDAQMTTGHISVTPRYDHNTMSSESRKQCSSDVKHPYVSAFEPATSGSRPSWLLLNVFTKATQWRPFARLKGVARRQPSMSVFMTSRSHRSINKNVFGRVATFMAGVDACTKCSLVHRDTIFVFNLPHEIHQIEKESHFLA